MFKGGMWHYDDQHDSLIATGNAGSQIARVALTLFYGKEGVYQMADKPLAPGEQMWVDVGEIIGSQLRDKNGKAIPPDTMSGTYEIKDLNDLNVGYLYEGKITTDETFGHATYGCAGCCGFDSTYLLPDPLVGPVGGGGDFTVWATNDCTGQDQQKGGAYNWTSSNTAVATVNTSGYMACISPGTTNVSSLISLRSPGVNTCPSNVFSQGGSGNVQPTVSGPNAVWWFNGQNPDSSDDPISVTLTSSGGSSTSWSVSQSDTKVSLSSTSGSTTKVSSTGSHFSASVGDISITATANGATSKPFTMTARTPWKLSLSGTPSTVCDAKYTYITDISYSVLDNLSTVISSDIFWNEVIGACKSANGSNWGGICIATSSGSTGLLTDELGGPPISRGPSPAPKCDTPPTGTISYETVPQTIYVGTDTTGSGVKVQTDTLTYYIDQGKHTGITSPQQPPQ